MSHHNTTKQCSHCKELHPKDANFCSKCGTSLKASAAQPVDPCNHCGVREKFPGHDFCSRSCGRDHKTRVANLCKNCELKPKSLGQQYCSKECASLGNSDAPCPQCKVKQKYPGFDFCGFTCAVKAGAKQAAPSRPAVASSRPAAASSRPGPGSEPCPKQKCPGWIPLNGTKCTQCTYCGYVIV